MSKKIALLLILISLFLGCDLFQKSESKNEKKVSKPNESLVNGDFDEAIKAYDQIVKTGEGTPQDKLMWSLLSLANITVSDEMIEVANSFGIENYPTNLNQVVMSSMSGASNNLVPKIKNVDKFTTSSRNVEDIVEYNAVLLAVLYNIKENYKDGFNPLVDNYVDAFKVIDEIVDVLYSISDDDEFTLNYSFFNTEEYSPSRSEWPAQYDNGLNPQDIVIGKAELLPLLSMLEFIRGMQVMCKTLDYSIEVSTYWDIFNPVNGSFYKQEGGGEISINPNFDYSKIPSPLSSGFLMEREGAQEDLIIARDHFIDSVKYIQESLELISSRTSENEFFISPANPGITENDWQYVEVISAYTKTLADKIVGSMKDGKVIYFPTDVKITSFEEFDELLDNWPTDGAGVNLSKLFEKPLFALDNLLDLHETTYEPKIYFLKNNKMELMTKNDYSSEGEFFICFKDYTLNNLIVGAESSIENEILKKEEGFKILNKSVYIPLTRNQILAGCSLFPAGETFTFDGYEYKSTGSFYTAPLLLAKF